ncbi:PL29 family lyase N-terminal domain-containing protein [Alistipes onderdonkii]|uniref:PL29 family lyase N-terminal domain-containing protein n=1 Tax=Alistipes onderdonkii TaxID=328813 RepID=UPI0036F278BB
MKKILSVFCIATLLFASCSDEYDDSALTGRVDNLENRIAKLEELCKQMNTNISSLQTIITALQKNDYVTGVAPITQNGKEIGYTITFSKSDPITIYHGKDGQDGTDGSDGKPGADGQDGHTPVISVEQDANGVYYWTLDGKWLTDDSGNKIKAEGTDGKDGADGEDGTDGANGKDGITPKLEIREGYWYISYDSGTNWTQLGKATGEDGKDGEDGISGDSMFTNIDYETDADYVIFSLSNGTQIKLPTWSAFEALKTLCNQMNTNISSLQTIVTALQNNDYITEITPIIQDGTEIGYTIKFNKNNPITIYHGKNGQDGTDGADGKPGADGQDGHTPVIGVNQDTDGVYYWTLDGKWLTDDSGNKIKAEGTDGKDGADGSDGEDGTDGANGKDGITPKLEIREGYWYISYDNGTNWTQLGKATGEDGTDAVSIFKEITQDEDYIHFKLQDDSVVSVPKHHPLSIAFTETEDIRVLADKTYSIGYTITGADENTVIKALAQDGFRAVVKKTDDATGTIEITTPSTILPSEVLIFVTDGKERTIMRSINFVEGVIVITTKSYTVDYGGGTVTVDLSTNIDYTVEIPETDKSWISVADTRTRAVMRDETLTFTIAANPALSVRYSTIRLVDALGVTSETILITQKSGTSQSVHVATAGTLDQLISAENKDIIEELTITGKINTFDFDFIRTLKNLKALDISGTDNTTIPASCFANSTIKTVLLPLKLTAIPNRAFYQAAIKSIYIPETVETIGDYAFYQCKSIAGNLIIPNATTTIGAYCFQESTFDGTLTLGTGLLSIGEKAFFASENLTGDLIVPDNVQTLGTQIFEDCTGFSGNLIVGNGIKIVPERAFTNCSGLAGAITLGENITEIGDYAFANCQKLTGNLIIPDKVATIGQNAFICNNMLTGYLSLGSSVSKIGAGAFSSQKDRKETGSGFITFYKESLFSRIYCKSLFCPTLSSATGYGVGYSKPYLGPASGYAFGYYNTTLYLKYWPACTLFVPVGCKSAYASAAQWEYFDTIEEVEF